MKKIKVIFRRLLSPVLSITYFIKRKRQKLSMRLLYKKGGKVNEPGGVTLFWVPGGMPSMLQMESAIASAMKLRGEKVHAVICDGVYSACVKREITDHITIDDWKKTCNACKKECSNVLDTMGIPFSFIGDHVSQKSLTELKGAASGTTWENLDNLKYQDVAVGKNVRSGILRFLKGYDFPDDESLVNEYAFSGLVCAAAAEQAIEKMKPSRVFMSHGAYVDWGPALHTALAKGVQVTAWMASYLPARFYLRHVEDGAHIDFHNMSATAWKQILNNTFTPKKSESLKQYLEGRYKRDTSFDMKYFKAYTGRVSELRSKYQLDSTRPVWGVMAHINWDTVSDYSPMLYESFNEWMSETIQTIKDVTNVQWVIKIHPAEAWDNPESGVENLIKKIFPNIPENIRILSAEENISPLDFFSMMDGGVTVYGTAGLELALHGKPVILAGDGHYGKKGFTYDASSKEQYRQLLKQAGSLPMLDEAQLELVKKYAYCYFIQRQIPFAAVKDPNSKWWNFQFDKRQLLLEGKDPVVDFICEKIIDGEDFIMDEQLLAVSEKV